MKAELHKSGKVFFAVDQSDKLVALEVLVDGGPLCVAGIWDPDKGRLAPGLYWIYVRRFGIHFGPFYAGLSLAERDMRKALKIQPGLWENQPRDWYGRQKWLGEWIEKNMGERDWLIGGVWAKD